MHNMTRRLFLGTAGTLVALPLLESLLPRQARSAATSPVRLVLYYCPVGMVVDAFVPKQFGANYTLSPILQPLAPVQADLLVLSNMRNVAADSPPGLDNGKHALGLGTLATSAALTVTSSGSPVAATSFDQVYAQTMASQTPVGSLQLGVRVDGDTDPPLPAIETTSLSWSDANTPIPPQTDPVALFNNFFAGPSSAQAAAEAAQRTQTRKSVLDTVLGEANGLKPKLGKADSQKLDQYFVSVRALEQRLQAAAPAACAQGIPPQVATDFPTLYKNMNDLMVLALTCNMTNVISFMFGNAHCDHLYQFLPGITDTHHSLSHRTSDTSIDAVGQLTTIDTWEMTIFSSFLQALKAVPEGNGSLLDNSVVLMTSELADGALHNYTPMPVLLAGGGGGFIKPGRHIDTSTNGKPADTAALTLAIMQGLGLPTKSWGCNNVSTPLPGLSG